MIALALGVTVWTLIANDYGIHEERVTIAGPRGELHADLVTPIEHDGPHGLVIFVHDDGPADADRGDQYKPLWDSFAKAGYASLSWDKPGVDGAPGNWLDQSMHDRAAEVEAAISWAYSRPDLDATRIGLWGAGQAGLVIPEVLARRHNVRFATLVGPTVDWARQTRFEATADLGDASKPEVDAAARARAERVRLLRDGASHADYLRAKVDAEPLTATRWRFEETNIGADATADLGRISVPTLLILGGHDRVTDVDATEKAYRTHVPADLLTVKRFDDATHRITRNDIEYRDDLRVKAREMFAPRTVYAPGYLDALRVFARRNSR